MGGRKRRGATRRGVEFKGILIALGPASTRSIGAALTSKGKPGSGGMRFPLFEQQRVKNKHCQKTQSKKRGVHRLWRKAGLE